ncbi:MAG: 8-amino-7-oxononanoate synthase [Bacteroidota bacterium]|jgi:8-amino-7-oxononanoate synthase|nr:8-amino-7-oxononanoate synthase [Bacteroidota bacterium]
MSFSADLFLTQSLNKRREQNAFRQLVHSSGLIDFCSNDYLGFAQSQDLKKRVESDPLLHANSNNGSGGSRLLAGNTSYAEQLEKTIAEFHNAEAGLIYNSGYDANVGLFSALGQKDASIIYDELIHASVHDGIKMSSASSYMFKHNDLLHLEERLKVAMGTTYVAVESIYSMDGDEALLTGISALCQKYNANLIVDEAHATGITVNQGKGLVQLNNVESAVFARVHTFGKALGCHGAIVLGSDLLRNYLINFSRSFIYTTALPIHSLLAIGHAYNYLEEQPEKISLLQELIGHFKELASESSHLRLIASSSPIQCIVIPGNLTVKELAASLQKKGFDVRPILSPTVAKGKERLRICLHAFNTKEEISRLLRAINTDLQTISG